MLVLTNPRMFDNETQHFVKDGMLKQEHCFSVSEGTASGRVGGRARRPLAPSVVCRSGATAAEYTQTVQKARPRDCWGGHCAWAQGGRLGEHCAAERGWNLMAHEPQHPVFNAW